MKKVFLVFVIFLVSVSVFAQQGKVEPSDNTPAQESSKKEITSADSTIADKRPAPDSSSTVNSTEQDNAGANNTLTLKISTDPTEAGLKIGERDYGLTPVTITDLDAGEHILELSKSGHFRRRVTIQLDSAGADLHFELLRPASVFVTSEPEGAQISFGGKHSGVTPFQSERLRPGDYPLSLSIDGYELYETTVNLKSGINDTLRITLESIEQKTVLPESQTAQAQQISQPEKSKKSLLNKEYTRTGIAAVAFFVFIAVLIGVEKTSY